MPWLLLRRRRGALAAVVVASAVLAPALAKAEKARKVRIAVVNLNATMGVDPRLAQVVTAQIAAHIQSRTGAAVISQSDIEAQLGMEKSKQLLGCTDGSCMAQIAGALGVDYLVSGSLAKVGTTIVFDADVIDSAKCVVIRRYSDRVKGADEDAFLDEADRAAAALFPDGARITAQEATPNPNALAASSSTPPTTGTAPSTVTTPAPQPVATDAAAWEVGLNVASELTAQGGLASLSVGRRFNDQVAVNLQGIVLASKHGGVGIGVDYIPLWETSLVHPVLGLEVPLVFADSALIGVAPRIGVELKPMAWAAFELGVPFYYFFNASTLDRPYYLFAQLSARADF